MARLDLERKIESLEEEIQFLRKIHEEVRPGGRREAHQVTVSKRERERNTQRNRDTNCQEERTWKRKSEDREAKGDAFQYLLPLKNAHIPPPPPWSEKHKARSLVSPHQLREPFSWFPFTTRRALKPREVFLKKTPPKSHSLSGFRGHLSPVRWNPHENPAEDMVIHISEPGR